MSKSVVWKQSGALALVLSILCSGAAASEQPRISIVTADEPGEPLIVTGTIYANDGSTPLPGIFLEIHQATVEGVYERDQDGEPRLKGVMKTGTDGTYEFRTIRPGSYPQGRIPAHIHARIWGPGIEQESITDYLFEGDPFLSSGQIARARGTGSFSPIINPVRGEDGILRGVRDIRLDVSPDH